VRTQSESSVKEAEIRPDDLFDRYLELSRQDIAKLFSDPSERRECPCPGCGGGNQLPAFEKHGFTYVECDDCRSLFVSPRPRPEALDRLYRDSDSSRFWAREFFPAVAEARREKIIGPRVQRILERIALEPTDGGPRTVIDAGAGAGVFLDELRRARPGIEPIAVEPGAELAEQCRQRALALVQKPVERCHELEGRGALVTSFEVIEHVYDPLGFVSALRDLAQPGGLVLVTGLGGDGFDIQMLWERSKSVSPPHHLNFLSVEGLERLFERAGCVDVEVETPGLLDVELVQKEISNGARPELPRFFNLLLERRDQGVLDRFQRFLQEARLSSHTWIWARRPTERGH